MTRSGPSRPAALGLIALVALLAAVATERRVDPPHPRPAVVLPESGKWQVAVAAALPAGTTPTGCGLGVPPGTLAVSHPVLPCGVRVVLEAGDVTASVQVGGRAAAAGGAAFGLTPELARVLRLGNGPHSVRWALAAR